MDPSLIETFFQTTEEEEAMELVPHITLNPSFNIDMLEYLEAEDDSPIHELSAQVSILSTFCAWLFCVKVFFTAFV